jgi:hypothetical protein
MLRLALAAGILIAVLGVLAPRMLSRGAEDWAAA